MKSEIIEYLKDRQQASVDELAAALGKESSKDFSSLVKTISQMEESIRFVLMTRGGLSFMRRKSRSV